MAEPYRTLTILNGVPTWVPQASLLPGTPGGVLVYDAAGNPVELAGAPGGVLLFDAAGTPIVLARGADGQVLTLPVGGGPPAWAAAPTAGGWQTILDLDFTAQASQTLSADGNYTIGGLTFKKENSTNDATAMALTNGTGLVVQPKSTGDYTNATRTAPLLWLALSQLGIPNLDWSTGIRIWACVSSSNYAANFDNSFIGLDGDNMNWSYIALRGWDTNSTNWIRRTIGGTSVLSGVGATKTHDSTDAVSILTIPGVVNGVGAFHSHYGAYSGGWPATTATVEVGGATDGSGFSTQGGGAAAGNAIGNYGVFLGALRAGSATALSVTFARLRVDYRL